MKRDCYRDVRVGKNRDEGKSVEIEAKSIRRGETGKTSLTIGSSI